MKNGIKSVIFGLFLIVICNVVCGVLITLLFGGKAAACDLELDQGIAWIDENTYYMPVEVYEITDDEVIFHGSNELIYHAKIKDFCYLDGIKIDDFQWLATMSSNNSHYWFDDEIMALWRA